MRGVAVLVLVLAATVTGQEQFFRKYALSKLFANCFGNELYYARLALNEEAKDACQQAPLVPLPAVNHNNAVNIITSGLVPPQVYYHVPSTQTFPAGTVYHHGGPVVYGRQKRQVVRGQREPFFNRAEIEGMVDKVYAGLSNLTCTLRTIGAIDENLNIRIDNVINYINGIPTDSTLKQDLLTGASFCHELTRCLPVEKLGNPLPAPLQRVLAYLECDRKARRHACFKHDIRQNIFNFDTSGLPNDQGRTSDIEKLATLFIGADSVDDVQELL